eukprot:157411-Chlamydomonas_euryale.AAC.1
MPPMRMCCTRVTHLFSSIFRHASVHPHMCRAAHGHATCACESLVLFHLQQHVLRHTWFVTLVAGRVMHRRAADVAGPTTPDPANGTARALADAAAGTASASSHAAATATTVHDAKAASRVPTDISATSLSARAGAAGVCGGSAAATASADAAVAVATIASVATPARTPHPLLYSCAGG